MSDLATLSAIRCCCFCLYSSLCSTAYPPAALASAAPSTSTNFAPKLCTSSFTAGLVSNTSTTAPSRLAVAIACKPATPAPSINILAGAILPAAVMNIGKYRLYSAAAVNTALYPAILACELNTSIACARVVRGMVSILKIVLFCEAHSFTF